MNKSFVANWRSGNHSQSFQLESHYFLFASEQVSKFFSFVLLLEASKDRKYSTSDTRETVLIIHYSVTL